MGRPFNFSIKNKQVSSHTKEVIKIENGEVVTYINVDGVLVKKPNTFEQSMTLFYNYKCLLEIEGKEEEFTIHLSESQLTEEQVKQKIKEIYSDCKFIRLISETKTYL